MRLKERGQEFLRDARELGASEAITKLLKRELMVRLFGARAWDPVAAERFIDWGSVKIGSKQIQVELSHPGPRNPRTTLLIPTGSGRERGKILGISVTEDGDSGSNVRDVVARFEVPFSGIKLDDQRGGVAFTDETGKNIAIILRNSVSLEPGFRVIEPEIESALAG